MDSLVGLGREQATVVRTARVRTEKGMRRMQVKGVLTPIKEQNIVAPFAGTVVELPYKSGDVVRGGAVVAVVQSKVLAQRAADLETTVGAARKELETTANHLASVEAIAAKNRALYEQDLIARRDLERAQHEVDAAQAQRDFARSYLAQQEALLVQARTVQGLSRQRAPFSGVVSRRIAELHATVAESARLLTLADVSTLVLIAQFSGVEVDEIQSGVSVEVSIPGMPGKMVFGKIARVSRSSGGNRPALEVEVQISNKTTDIFTPGRSVEAAFPVESLRESFWLPRSSVVSMNAKSYVYKLNDGKAWLQEVTLGMERNEEVEIKTGVLNGDVVVTNPPATLKSGSRIEPAAERAA
ncbi:MAG TPA: efflux RND transporter periplasmic adaptor subunit [Terriglobales bacterium]|nr:efflux RND transporter periplasmic adaptor subunit [Terriglobales bacterium]